MSKVRKCALRLYLNMSCESAVLTVNVNLHFHSDWASASGLRNERESLNKM